MNACRTSRARNISVQSIVAALAVGGLALAAAGTSLARASHAADRSPPWDDPIAGGGYQRVPIIASTGTVDEEDAAEVEFRGGRAQFRSSVTQGKITLRYPIQFVSGNNDISCDSIWLHLRYLDDGAPARVVGRLKGINVDDGSATTILTLDSDDFKQASDFLRRNVNNQGAGIFNLDSRTAYFVEVTLTRNGAAGNPALASIEVFAHVE